MSYDSYRVSVKVLENGFEVEVPDWEAIAAKKAAAKKNKMGDTYSPYIGDCTKCYAEKNINAVLARVKSSLQNMPEASEYAAGFAEAAAADK